MSLSAKLVRLSSLQAELLGLARVMVGLLESGQAQALDDAWEKRQRLFPKVATAYRDLQPWLTDWSGTLAHLPPDQAAEAQNLMDGLSRQGREVLALDERAKELLKAELGRLGAELTHLNQGQRLRQAYRAEQAPPCPTQVSRVG